MNLISVDDEPLVLSVTTAMCRSILPEGSEINGFTRASDALSYAAANPVDVALLDIDMPGMNGLMLAARLKELRPDTAVIFVTGYAQYAVEAFNMHVQGYLLKPISRDRLKEEIGYAMAGAPARSGPVSHISVRTFGFFDLLVDGKTVSFARSKSKELLAYLVDRQGSGVTRAEAAAALWEDSDYDRSMQKQLDVVIRSLRATLEECGAGELLELQRGTLRIKPELIDCDLYRFLSGDINAVNSYRGEYMNAYSWAELTAGFIERKLDRGL